MNPTEQNLKKIKFEMLSEFNADCWIAGGAITDLYLGRKIRDIDIFFGSNSEVVKAKNKLISIGGKLIFEYPQGFNVKYKGMNYDLAHIGANVHETIENFDYTVCAIAVGKDKKFIYHKDYFDHLEKMELHYAGNHPNKFYVNKAKRLLRYMDKGFSLDEENLEKWLNTLIKDHKKPQRRR